jgi:hypothetical protein
MRTLDIIDKPNCLHFKKLHRDHNTWILIRQSFDSAMWLVETKHTGVGGVKVFFAMTVATVLLKIMRGGGA